ncbi:hypothetical protein PFISCL1PPCAC_275, partial [Pristionchus fissidentatus]
FHYSSERPQRDEYFSVFPVNKFSISVRDEVKDYDLLSFLESASVRLNFAIPVVPEIQNVSISLFPFAERIRRRKMICALSYDERKRARPE